MPFQHGIFYESQRGGLCRLHSINGFFGKVKLTTSQFTQYSKELDKYIKEKFHEESHCLKFDYVSSDHNILVSFILKHYGIYTRYFPINSLYQKRGSLQKHIGDLKGDFFFIFNSGHIWGARKKDGQWYKVDSLSGVSRFNMNSLESSRNTGFLIPVHPKVEFYRNLDKIQIILKKAVPDLDISDHKGTAQKIGEYLKKLNDSHSILGELEVPLGVTMNILDVVYGKCGDYIDKGSETDFKLEQFKPIERVIKRYDEFLYNFTPSQYHNYELKDKYLTDILLTLLKLKVSQ